MKRKALLIIDMQKGSFAPEAPCFDTYGVVTRINALAEIFRESDFPVIVIRHDGTKLNEYIPHTTEWELLDDLSVKPADIFIDKTANDSFYNTQLQPTLTALAIDELVITGSATEFCIDSTIQSALVKDYNVTVVEDAHTTGTKSHLDAAKIVEHYNWVWKYLIPTNGKIDVIKFEQLKEMLKISDRS